MEAVVMGVREEAAAVAAWQAANKARPVAAAAAAAAADDLPLPLPLHHPNQLPVRMARSGMTRVPARRTPRVRFRRRRGSRSRRS